MLMPVWKNLIPHGQAVGITDLLHGTHMTGVRCLKCRKMYAGSSVRMKDYGAIISVPGQTLCPRRKLRKRCFPKAASTRIFNRSTCVKATPGG